MLNSNENSIDILLDINKTKVEIDKDLPNNTFNFEFKNNIKIENLSFGYEKNNILKDLNLVINKGDIIGISGKNGSGKTTFCNILLSIIKPKSGKIIVDDTYDLENYLKEYRNIVSFIPQNIFLLNDTIKNNITFNLEDNLIDNEKLKKVIKISGLDEINKKISDRYNSLIGENGTNLSGGQRQRVAIARSLFRESEIIIMDEHTSALDSSTEEELLNEMKSLFKDKTIIIISHRKKF